MLPQILTIKSVFPKYLNVHLFLLNFDDHIQFALNRLYGFIAALIILKELLHVFEGVPKFRLMNQA